MRGCGPGSEGVLRGEGLRARARRGAAALPAGGCSASGPEAPRPGASGGRPGAAGEELTVLGSAGRSQLLPGARICILHRGAGK